MNCERQINPTVETIRKIAFVAGREALRAGAIAGNFAVDQYRKMDPDVMRHFKQVPLLSYTLFISNRNRINPGRFDGHPPLIFVHGLGGDRGNLFPMAWYMWLMGRKRSYKIHFNAGMNIEQMSEALAEFINDVVEVTGEPKVEIVGHSLGGVVSRLAIDEYGLNDKVKTLITLGSPHKGTYAARYAGTEITRALRPDSDFIKRLNSRPWPAGVRGIAFFSRNDLLIIPAEAALVKGADHIDVTPFTHFSYLIDPRCWAAVERILSEDGRRALIERTCAA